jgi:hypothetical protein
MATEKLMAYCLKTKQKEEMLNAEIVKTKKGGYMAQGTTKDGHKMSLMMSEATALKAIKDGTAKKAY